MKNNKSFTLIEILFVVVIIGIVSSLIMINVTNSRKETEIARGKAFSLSIVTNLSGSLVSQWKFDEISTVTNGMTILDTWGANDGILTGTPVLKSGVDCISGKCLEFDGGIKYITMPSNSSLQIIKNQTIELWVKPNSFSARRNSICKAYGGELSIIQELNGSVHYLYGTSGVNGGTYQAINTNYYLQSNNWYHLLATRSLTTSPMTLKWFVNGRQTNTATASFATATASTLPLYIAYGYSGNYYSGIIDEVKIYNYAFTVSQVKQNYFAGINKLMSKNGLSKEEYNQRLVEINNNLIEHE